MLYRLDETQWQFCHKEKPAEIIRVITPGFLNNRAADYALAKKASEFLSVIDSVGNFTTWDCFAKPGEILPPEVAKRWQIIDVTKKYWRELQDQSLVYKHDFTNPGVRVFEVRPDSYLDAISLYFQNWISSSPTPPSLRPNFLSEGALPIRSPSLQPARSKPMKRPLFPNIRSPEPTDSSSQTTS